MNDWIRILQELADSPTEFERQADVIYLPRRGREYLLTVRELPGLGLSVAATEKPKESDFQPLDAFIQSELLQLPQLARQLVKTLERGTAMWPVPYVDGPARVSVNGDVEGEGQPAGTLLERVLDEAIPGSTKLVQLMAPAGQGKTILLESIALGRASRYTPAQYPSALLVPVDLLGRYVGTIDDAIAGTLNNTYLFPALTQREVALCIRQRWVILGLDGFDELAARVGIRDAFLRVTELLDQLDGSGTVIISAREGFFQLYDITTALRAYLQPRRGSYSTVLMDLMPWTAVEGEQVFGHLGSAQPQRDLAALREAFGPPDDVVLHPFFLTRLAGLWLKGERFGGADEKIGRLARTEYAISRFLDRESGEKWTDRDRQAPLLSPDGHTSLLGAIAEEMWRAEAFVLDADEIRLSAEIGLQDQGLDRDTWQQVLEKAPVHAALTPRGRGYGFLHERFFAFFLGHRLAQLVTMRDASTLGVLLGSRDVPPEVVQWLVWKWRAVNDDVQGALEFLASLSRASGETAAGNIGRVVAQLANGRTLSMELAGLQFAGDAVREVRWSGLTLRDSDFWNVDFSGFVVEGGGFVECRFSDVLVDQDTRFHACVFRLNAWRSLEMVGGERRYAPDAIQQQLERLGATVEQRGPGADDPTLQPKASLDALSVVEGFVRQSQLTCDVSLEQMEEKFGSLARDVARIGLETRVLRELTRPTKGPKQRFIRFKVDRELLVAGQVGRTPDPAIERFWEDLGERHPFRGYHS